jgi:hypothetical protein
MKTRGLFRSRQETATVLRITHNQVVMSPANFSRHRSTMKMSAKAAYRLATSSNIGSIPMRLS